MEAVVTEELIPATLDPRDAGRRTWDVVIVGAGPTGALAARQLALEGAKVLLMDRASFPRWKVCGCCLSGRAVSLLDRLGLLPVLRSDGAVPLRRFELRSGGQSLSLSLPAGYALSRTRLDARLIQSAIGAGADFLPDSEGRLGSLRPEVQEVIAVRSSDEVLLLGKVVLICEGLSRRLVGRESKFRSEADPQSCIGAGAVASLKPESLAPETVHMAVGRAGYVGAVQIEDHALNLAAALHPQELKRGEPLGKSVSRVLKEGGLDLPVDVEELTWRGTARLTRSTAPVASTRILVLGDAAGYVEPFTGEGMGWGLSSAADCVRLVLRGIENWSDDIENNWKHYHRRRVGARQRWCRRSAYLLRKPMVLRSAMRLVNICPWLASPVIRHLNASWHPEKWTI